MVSKEGGTDIGDSKDSKKKHGVTFRLGQNKTKQTKRQTKNLMSSSPPSTHDSMLPPPPAWSAWSDSEFPINDLFINLLHQYTGIDAHAFQFHKAPLSTFSEAGELFDLFIFLLLLIRQIWYTIDMQSRVSIIRQRKQQREKKGNPPS
jgi:hypothetical protein